MRVTIRVRPGSARPGVGGGHDGALIVRVSARAVDGKATEAALTAVADSFGARRSAVRLVSGASSRTKIVDIDAGDPRLLASLLATPGRLRPRRDIAAVRPFITSDLITNPDRPNRAGSCVTALSRSGRRLAHVSSSRLRYKTESHPQPGGRTVKMGREAKARMSLWRIRIAMSDDWRSQELLTEALAGQRVCSRLMSPHDTEMSADVIIELTDIDGLGTLLGELHMISPQVFVSSADQPSPLPA